MAQAADVGATTGERYVRYAAIFLAPFLNLRSEVAYFTVSDGLFCVTLLVLVLTARIPRSPFGIVTILWLTSFTLVAGGLLVSSLYAGDPIRGLVLTFQYFFCFVLLPYAVLQTDLDEAYRLLFVFVLGVIALDVHGIITFYAIGYSPGSRVVTGGVRLATLNGNANGAACLNAMTLVMVLWLHSIRRMSGMMTLAFVCIISLTIVLTSSNTGLIAAAVGILCYLAITRRMRLLFGIFVIVFAAGIFLYNGGTEYLPATFQKRVLQAVVSGDITDAGTFESRQRLNLEALEMISARGPTLLGIGADEFRTVSVQEIPVHNTLLILWVEGGIIAFSGWVLLLFLGIIVSMLGKGKAVAASDRGAIVACFAIFAVVASASTHIYARFWFAALLLVLQPAIIALARLDRSEPRAQMQWPPPQRRSEVRGRTTLG